MSANSEIGRILLSAVGAIVASATCLVAAAAPARAASPAANAAQVVVTVPATTGLVGAVRY